MSKLINLLVIQQSGRIFLLAFMITGFYWYAVYNDGSAIDNQIAGISSELEREQRRKIDTDATLKQVKEMQEKVGQISSKYQEISRRLPHTLFSIDINKAIDDFAKNAGVSVKTKKPGDNIKSTVVEEVPVDVVLEGTYAELAQFTYIVSMAERAARVKNIVISISDPNSKKLRFEGQVVGYKLAADEKKPTDKMENR